MFHLREDRIVCHLIWWSFTPAAWTHGWNEGFTSYFPVFILYKPFADEGLPFLDQGRVPESLWIILISWFPKSSASLSLSLYFTGQEYFARSWLIPSCQWSMGCLLTKILSEFKHYRWKKWKEPIEVEPKRWVWIYTHCGGVTWKVPILE